MKELSHLNKKVIRSINFEILAVDVEFYYMLNILLKSRRLADMHNVVTTLRMHMFAVH